MRVGHSLHLLDGWIGDSRPRTTWMTKKFGQVKEWEWGTPLTSQFPYQSNSSKLLQNYQLILKHLNTVLGMGLRPLSAGFEKSAGSVLLTGWCNYLFLLQNRVPMHLLFQMNGVPKMSVIRKVCSEMHLLIKELFLLNLKAPPEIQNTERFSYRKFVSTDFSKSTFRDFL